MLNHFQQTGALVFFAHNAVMSYYTNINTTTPSTAVTTLKTNMPMEKNRALEDVLPIKHGDFPAIHIAFR